MEESNQLVDLTNQILISFFDTEIECNEENEFEKEDQILLDIQNEKPENTSANSVSDDAETNNSLNRDEIIEKIMSYKMNDIFISKMQTKIEKKFINYQSKKTLSIIKNIEKYGISCYAEFFFMILKIITNEKKNIIIQIISILKYFILSNQSSLISLFQALVEISNSDLSIDIIENILLILQMLYSLKALNFDGYQLAVDFLLKNQNSIPIDSVKNINDDFLISKPRYDVNTNHQIELLKRKNEILEEKYQNLIIENRKLKDEKSLFNKSNESKSFQNNKIFDEMIQQSKIEPNLRVYSKHFYDLMTVAFIIGSPCYRLLQKYLPIPHERNIRKKFSPVLQRISNNLTNEFNCDEILKDLNLKQPKNDPLYVTLAIDAAKFKNIEGKFILKSLPNLKYIQENKIYKNIFVFHIQSINKKIDSFPIYVRFAESGSANEDIKKVFLFLKKKLAENNIIIKFVATDGDHYYDIFHDLFFQQVLQMIKQKKTFLEIVNQLSQNFLKNDIYLPISDFLHSIKLLRSYFLEGKINLDILSNIEIFPHEMQKYNLGHVISDDSAIGKMKDSYSLKLFSTETVLKSIEFKDYHLLFFILPFNVIIESLKNPNLSIDSRVFLLDLAYQFLFFHLFQKNYNKNSIHSRIGIERIINTIIGLAVALKSFDFIRLGNISSHPLENLFGIIRLSSHYDHSWYNMINSLSKGFFIKTLIDKNNISIKRRERLNEAGVAVGGELIQKDGEISAYTPFQLFTIIWANMKQNNELLANHKVDIKPFVIWFKNYKKIQWNECIYIPSKLSGSSIINRYKTDEYNELKIIRKEKRKQAMNKKKLQPQSVMTTRFNLNEFEIKALDKTNIKDFMEFLYQNPLNDYSNKLKQQIKKKEIA